MLNKDITLSLLEYWTPEDLGKMARINRGWKTLIYRDEIWNRFNWNIRTPSRFLQITDESHHFGNKQDACFWDWFLYHYTGCGSLSIQPLCMMSYKQHYGKWLQAGKPCKVLTHHDPRSCFIYQFTGNEKDHLIKSSVVRGSSGNGDGIFMNSYYQYLNNQILNKILPKYSSYIKLDISKCKTHLLYLSSTAATTTPLNISGLEFRKKCTIIDLNRLEGMLEEYEKSTAIVTIAKKALGRISREIFAQNQRIIQQANHPIWNSILWNPPM